MTSARTDLELQEVRDAASTNNTIRAAAMEKLFGSSPEALREWPGYSGYCSYLEECFEPLLADAFGSIWTSIGVPRPSKPMECWSWSNAISEAIRSTEERGTTADLLHVVKTSFQHIYAHDPPPMIDTTACLTAAFAVLCWSSMTLKPKLPASLDSSTAGLFACQQSYEESLNLKPDEVRRPIVAAFRIFHRSQRGRRWRQAICDRNVGQSSVLHVSTLNFQSLQTIGKIRLSWVSDLSSHLDFEPRTRTLSVFRFPTFCALTTAVESRGTVLEG